LLSITDRRGAQTGGKTRRPIATVMRATGRVIYGMRAATVSIGGDPDRSGYCGG